MNVDPKKRYPIDQAISLLRKVSLAKFNGTVELHINTRENNLRGSVTFPHGTGKKQKVEIADKNSIDKIVKKIENGTIDFDVLVAHPEVMSVLGKYGKILGPKGLMPNPKAGTISKEPEKVAEKLKEGKISWKTESKFPIIHQVIGKLSFDNSQIEENYQVLIKSIGKKHIKNITLKSTISPAIKIEVPQK